MTMEEKVFAGFYLEKLYFIPHFEPVIQELRKRGLSYTVIIPSNLDRDEVDQRHEAVAYCRERNLVYCLREDCPAVEYLVFANGVRELGISYQKSVLIFHGTWGGKSVYLDPGLNEVDIRFIDGRFYEDILNEYFPEKKCELCVTGYSKLDAYFDFKEEDKTGLLKRCGLDPCKKTILYAPTFYPSSILKIGSDFPVVLKDYNIIVKPHSNIFLRSKYRHTLKHIRKWGKHENVFIAGFGETNILPFMYAADLMISDICTNEVGALPSHITASNFGKITSGTEKEDIAPGLLNMVFQTIGMLSVFALRNDTVKDVVLTGSLANMSIASQVMRVVEEISDVKFFIPENATFATAIGAALPFVRNARI